MLAADSASTEPGLYACGWVKRGPTGIIGALHRLQATQAIIAATRACESSAGIWSCCFPGQPYSADHCRREAVIGYLPDPCS